MLSSIPLAVGLIRLAEDGPCEANRSKAIDNYCGGDKPTISTITPVAGSGLEPRNRLLCMGASIRTSGMELARQGPLFAARRVPDQIETEPPLPSQPNPLNGPRSATE